MIGSHRGLASFGDIHLGAVSTQPLMSVPTFGGPQVTLFNSGVSFVRNGCRCECVSRNNIATLPGTKRRHFAVWRKRYVASEVETDLVESHQARPFVENNRVVL